MPESRRASIVLFCCTFAAYAYFFQGYGYNQNAHFDTIRALVERRTFKITDYAQPGQWTHTGDVSYVGNEIYSSKPPGFALLAAPAYAMIYAVERTAGVDVDAEPVMRMNLYLLTVLTAALPASILVVAMYHALGQRGSSPREAFVLAAAFGFGTLLLPYSGMMMVHVAVAMFLFVAWLLMQREPMSRRQALTAGLLLAAAVASEYLAAPLMLGFAVIAWRRRPNGLLALVPPILAGVGLLMFHKIHFGSAFATAHTFVNPFYRSKDLLFGHFDWPQPIRLYWLTLHPNKGLLYCCPIFVLPLLALLQLRRPLPSPRTWLFPLAVIAYFLSFELCFDGWSGGFGVGPRYLIPALPFAFLFAPPTCRRFPRIAIALIVVSVVSMLAVTAVRVQSIAKTFGSPLPDDPVAEALKRLTMNQLARTDASFNLGLLLGLKGVWSLLPPLLIILATFAFSWHRLPARGVGTPTFAAQRRE